MRSMRRQFVQIERKTCKLVSRALGGMLAMILLAACGTGNQAAIAPTVTSSPSAGAQSAKAGGSTGGLTPVKVSYNTAATTDLPFYVAEDQGYFQREGIQPTLISMTPQVAIVALSKGEIEFMNSNSVEGSVKGFPFKIVWDSWAGAAWTIVGKKDIATPQALKGKLIATNNPGTPPY